MSAGLNHVASRDLTVFDEHTDCVALGPLARLLCTYIAALPVPSSLLSFSVVLITPLLAPYDQSRPVLTPSRKFEHPTSNPTFLHYDFVSPNSIP